jgi:DNA-binding HxlR family transcriptional regulator
MGTNASPDETVMIAARVCFSSNGSSAAVRRIGPSRFVVTVASASPRATIGCTRHHRRRTIPSWRHWLPINGRCSPWRCLATYGRLRFTRLGELIGGVSQKMLTKTLRQMEADGLVVRTVFPVIPPRVEYELTNLGLSLGSAFCGVWIWAEHHREAILRARKIFDKRAT